MQKKYILYKRDNLLKGYIYKDSNDVGMEILGCLLKSEIGGDLFIGWLKGKFKGISASGNVLTMREEPDKTISVYFQWDVDEIYEHPERKKDLIFNTTRENLLKIIEDWCKVYFQKDEGLPEADEILITQDEYGKVEIKPIVYEQEAIKKSE